MNITLGEGVTLPIEAVTETFAVIANRGAGKSSTGRVLVEELHSAGQPVIVLDPKGDWHGLRSSKDGKKAGLPFVIIGGDHGDLYRSILARSGTNAGPMPSSAIARVGRGG